MAQISGYWEGTTTGDAGAYSSETFSNVIDYYFRSSLATNYRASGYLAGTATTLTDMPLKVTQSSPTARTVDVEPGAALVLGRYYFNDANETLTIAANTSGSTRIDTIALSSDWSAQTIRLVVVAGTPAGSPVPPTLTQLEGTLYQIPIANVTVVNGASTILNSDIDTSVHVPIPRSIEQVKEAVAGSAISTFNSLWDGSNQSLNELSVVQYNDASGLFVSPDNGSNYYRVGNNIAAVTYNGSYISSSSTWADVDAVNLSLSVTTTGGDLIIGWGMTAGTVGGGYGAITFTVDGVRVTNGTAATGGFFTAGISNGVAMAANVTPEELIGVLTTTPLFGTMRVGGVSTGTHTIRLQFAKLDYASSTAFYIYSSGANANHTDATFWAMEV